MVGRQPEGCRLLTDGQLRTRRCWRGAAEYTDMDGEEAKRKKGERIRERCPGGQRTRVNLGGGERRGPEPSQTGIHRNLNIGTESRVQITDALGKELHHPKMSKLWDSKTGPTDRQT